MRRIITFLALFFTFLGNAQIGFETEFILTKEGPSNIKTNDLDNDGDQDIIFASNRVLGWYENLDGMGNFGGLQTIAGDGRLTKLNLADIDNDGDIDIFGIIPSRNGFGWYENLDGLGTFSTFKERFVDPIGTEHINELFASDLDGDGDADVITVTDNIIAWYENLDSLGLYGSKNIIYSASGFGESKIDSKDIDGDGDNDVVINANPGFYYFENLDGLGTFDMHIFGSGLLVPNTINISDIDGDGDMDLISSDRESPLIVWFENLDGNGDFSSAIQLPSTNSRPRDLETADFDSDGDLDIVVALNTSISGESGLAWFENLDGLGTFSNANFVSPPLGSLDLISASDFNNDGHIDLLIENVLNNDSHLFWFENIDGQGTFGIQNEISFTSIFSTLDLVDLDGDLDKDVLVSGTNEIVWYENKDGLGTFESPRNLIFETSFVSGINSTPIDIENDGDFDIIFYENENNGFYLLNNLDGLGSFSIPILINNNYSNANDIVSADLNGDGFMDFICKSTVDDLLVWFKNENGSGIFSVGQEISFSNLGSSRKSLEAIDLDGDNDKDILIANTSEGFVWIENVDGSGNFQIAQTIDPYLGNISFESGDIDHDGDLDIVCAYRVEDKVVWFENIDGLGNFGTSQIIDDTADGAMVPNLADIDNDGFIDVFAGSADEDWIFLYKNIDGQGTFSNPIGFYNRNNMSLLEISDADINNDGTLDVFIIDGSDRTILYKKNLGLVESNIIFGSVKMDLVGGGCLENANNLGNVLVRTSSASINRATYTSPNGGFHFFIPEGSYITDLEYGVPDYYPVTPQNYASNFVGLGNQAVANFCIQPVDNINDLNISIYPLTDARPGFDVSYQLVYNNIGTTILSGTVDLVFDDSKLSFLDASEPVSSQTVNSVSFDYADLFPFEHRTITVNFNVAAPPTTEIGDLLVFEATVNPVAGDETEEDNVFELEQTVVGSFDPNDIQVLEGDEIFLSEAGDYLHYIIRFQNTGTASAINVRVTNDLDPNLDWTTMQLENISHSNRVEITNGSMVEFIFNNINLPDATTNEPESHGYIQYKIKPINTVDIGDSMSNNANIYFDFNPPILTNTVTTTIIENLGTEEYTLNSLKLYPNPSGGIVNIKSTQSINRLQVINQLGQAIWEIKKQEGITSFSIENLSAGIYFVNLIDENSNSVVKKLVKK